MGPQPAPMRVAIGKNLTSNHLIICITKHTNGTRFLVNAAKAIKQQSTAISAKSAFGPSRAVIPIKRLLGGQIKDFIRNRGQRTPSKTRNLETIAAMADQCLTQWVS